MKNKLKTILISQIVILTVIIAFIVIIKNIIPDKQVELDSTSQTVQVQQESVSTSETAESTIESSESVDESSSEIEDADSTESEAAEPADEASKITDETVESTDTNSEVQVDEPGTVNIDLDSDPDISSGLDGFTDPETEPQLPSAEQQQEFWNLVEQNGTVLH